MAMKLCHCVEGSERPAGVCFVPSTGTHGTCTRRGGAGQHRGTALLRLWHTIGWLIVVDDDLALGVVDQLLGCVVERLLVRIRKDVVRLLELAELQQ